MTVYEMSNRVLRCVGGQDQLRLTAFGVGIFALVNLPSLKILLGASSLINVLIVVALAVAGLRRANMGGPWRLPRERLMLGTGLIVVLVLTALPEVLALRRPAEAFANTFGQMVFLVLATLLVSIFAKADDVRTFVPVQIIWGTTVAALVMAGVIRYTEMTEGPFHYNTIGLPIALSTIGALSLWMGGSRPKSLVTAGWSGLVLVVNLVALLQLPSRTSMLGVPVICVMGVALSMVWGGPRWALGARLRRNVGLLAAFVLVSVISLTYSPVSMLMGLRLARLVYQSSEEPRMQFLPDTLATIKASPIGYGFSRFPELTAYQFPYPHNLILDALVSGGWLVGLLYSCLVLYPFLALLQLYQRRHSPLVLTAIMLAVHLFLIASTSYSWVHSYTLFGILATCFALRDEVVAEPDTGAVAPAYRGRARAIGGGPQPAALKE